MDQRPPDDWTPIAQTGPASDPSTYLSLFPPYFPINPDPIPLTLPPHQRTSKKRKLQEVQDVGMPSSSRRPFRPDETSQPQFIAPQDLTTSTAPDQFDYSRDPTRAMEFSTRQVYMPTSYPTLPSQNPQRRSDVPHGYSSRGYRSASVQPQSSSGVWGPSPWPDYGQSMPRAVVAPPPPPPLSDPLAPMNMPGYGSTPQSTSSFRQVPIPSYQTFEAVPSQRSSRLPILPGQPSASSVPNYAPLTADTSSRARSASHMPLPPSTNSLTSSTPPVPWPGAMSSTPMTPPEPERSKPRCWDHGCNGREFSTFSNLLRHQRERSGTAAKSYCPRCGAEFTRSTARTNHLLHAKCKPWSGSA